MSSPIQPPVDPSAPPVAAPAPGNAGMDEEIRQLARALNVQQQEALSGRKALIDSVSLGDASTAPTVTVDLAGILIPNVRVAASYTPAPGDTVLLLKQANEFFAAFKIQDAGSAVANSTDGGFIQATLDSGHGHNGNSNGNAMYRRVMEHGAWKIQWKGSITLGANDTIISGSNVLPSDFRPSGRRTIVCARDATNSVTVKVDFNTDGTVAVISPTTAPSGSTGGVSNHTHGGSTGFAGDSHFHTHGGAVAAASFVETHSHSIPSTDLSHSHSNSVARPSYIVFNGVEYFL